MTRFGQKPGGGGAPKKGGNAFADFDPDAGGERHPPLPYDSTNVLEIVKTIRAQNTGDCIVTEVKVLESDSTSVTVGGTYAIVQPIGDRWGYGIARFGKMVFAAGNLTDAEIAEAVAEAREGVGIINAACGDADGCAKYGENPLAGYKVRAYVTRGKDDGKGGNYRDHAFSAVE